MAKSYDWIDWHGLDYQAARELIIEKAQARGIDPNTISEIIRDEGVVYDNFRIFYHQDVPTNEVIYVGRNKIKEKPAEPNPDLVQTYQTKFICPRCERPVELSVTYTFTELIEPLSAQLADGFTQTYDKRIDIPSPTAAVKPHRCYPGYEQFGEDTIVLGAYPETPKSNVSRLNEAVFMRREDRKWVASNTGTVYPEHQVRVEFILKKEEK